MQPVGVELDVARVRRRRLRALDGARPLEDAVLVRARDDGAAVLVRAGGLEVRVDAVRREHLAREVERVAVDRDAVEVGQAREVLGPGRRARRAVELGQDRVADVRQRLAVRADLRAGVARVARREDGAVGLVDGHARRARVRRRRRPVQHPLALARGGRGLSTDRSTEGDRPVRQNPGTAISGG